MDPTNDPQTYTYQWFSAQFEKAKEQAVQFCEPISDDRFVQRPAEGVWSVAECYEHLNEFGDRYVDSIRAGLDGAPENSAEADQIFTPGLISRGVIKFFAPPYKIKIKTLGPFEPKSYASLDKETVLNRYVSLQDTLIRIMKEARDQRIDLSGAVTSHPLFGLLKMTAAECFAIVEVHQRRHQWQAEQVLKRIS